MAMSCENCEGQLEPCHACRLRHITAVSTWLTPPEVPFFNLTSTHTMPARPNVVASLAVSWESTAFVSSGDCGRFATSSGT